MERKFLPQQLDGKAWEQHYSRMSSGAMDYSPTSKFYTLKSGDYTGTAIHQYPIQLTSPVELDVSQAKVQLKEEEKAYRESAKRPLVDRDVIPGRAPPSKRPKKSVQINSSVLNDILS